jgi:hypothetical protein
MMVPALRATIGPDLASARRLLDAAGALISDARTRADHQGSGSAGAVEADFLLDAAIAIIAAVNERGPGGFAASKSLPTFCGFDRKTSYAL